MKRSTEHVLTTHTGSLPRPPALLDALQRRDHGDADGADLAGQIREAVIDIVRRQAHAGVTVVNDGEAGKIGYSTYVKERLDGFGGTGGLGGMPADLLEFPDYMQRVMGELDFEMPACVGPVAYRDLEAVRADIDNLQTAVAGADVEDAFMTAASPGVISVFLQNQYYPSHEEYIAALADVMKAEYDEIHRAGLVLQLDCPDLAMTRHMQPDESLEEFRRRAALHVEAINHATRDIPADDMRMHLCWGNYEGPHHHDVPLRDIIDIVLGARPAAISFEAANPRHEHEWTVFEDVRLPEGKVLIPGVLDSTTNYVEHPELVCQRIVRYAQLVGRENVIAGSDCGFATFASFLAIDPGITWAKLGAMADGARLASGRLW
ncbi:MAG TPA: cobalamin-independent methionine synthase II family protein [Solirubrobacteraceae bacterium]|nr:cobalamin-independent methionine synthase II family protein [Solirubrobacteraceae bacterium]